MDITHHNLHRRFPSQGLLIAHLHKQVEALTIELSTLRAHTDDQHHLHHQHNLLHLEEYQRELLTQQYDMGIHSLLHTNKMATFTQECILDDERISRTALLEAEAAEYKALVATVTIQHLDVATEQALTRAANLEAKNEQLKCRDAVLVEEICSLQHMMEELEAAIGALNSKIANDNNNKSNIPHNDDLLHDIPIDVTKLNNLLDAYFVPLADRQGLVVPLHNTTAAKSSVRGGCNSDDNDQKHPTPAPPPPHHRANIVVYDAAKVRDLMDKYKIPDDVRNNIIRVRSSIG